MITWPWCGTHYMTFQPNCSNCGGPLPFPSANSSPAAENLPTPPPPPRQFSDNYSWKLLSSDGWAVAASVFLLIGAIFTVVGVLLTLGVITAFVGIPFTVLGLAFLAAGGGIGLWRYHGVQKIMEVLRTGEATEGQILSLEENLGVRVNQRHPWTITYQFHVNGRDYAGRVSTLDPPGDALQAGKRALMLYLPNAPQYNVLYPHP